MTKEAQLLSLFVVFAAEIADGAQPLSCFGACAARRPPNRSIAPYPGPPRTFIARRPSRSPDADAVRLPDIGGIGVNFERQRLFVRFVIQVEIELLLARFRSRSRAADSVFHLGRIVDRALSVGAFVFKKGVRPGRSLPERPRAHRSRSSDTHRRFGTAAASPSEPMRRKPRRRRCSRPQPALPSSCSSPSRLLDRAEGQTVLAIFRPTDKVDARTDFEKRLEIGYAD